jgi:hypothetical protein
MGIGLVVVVCGGVRVVEVLHNWDEEWAKILLA